MRQSMHLPQGKVMGRAELIALSGLKVIKGFPLDPFDVERNALSGLVQGTT